METSPTVLHYTLKFRRDESSGVKDLGGERLSLATDRLATEFCWRMSSPTLVSLCDKLPTELAIRILQAGAYNDLTFAAKCMVLAKWTQRIAAPILYQIVTIHNCKQARSLLLAIERNLPSMTYNPRELIKSLVIDDESKKHDPPYAKVVAQIVIALNGANCRRLKIPVYMTDYAAASPTARVPLLPPSVCYTDFEPLFGFYKYEAVTRLRLVDVNLQMWEIRGLLAIAKGVTHLAIKVSSNSWAAMSLVDSAASVSRIQRLVVVVKMSPEEQHLSQLLKMREEPPTWLEGAGLSKVVIWEWNDQVQNLLENENDDLLWNAAEDALAQ